MAKNKINVSKEKEIVNESVITEDKQATEQVSEQVQKPKIRERLDENRLVPIASGVHGGLTYISRDGSVILKFEQYGDEDVIELRHLRAMLSQARKFLQKGWIRVLDDEVIEYLNLERFQRENVNPEDLEGLFDKKPEHILEVIKTSSVNAKRLIYARAKEKYINGELTNVHIIKAIEEGIGESLDPNK